VPSVERAGDDACSLGKVEALGWLGVVERKSGNGCGCAVCGTRIRELAARGEVQQLEFGILRLVAFHGKGGTADRGNVGAHNPGAVDVEEVLLVPVRHVAL